MVLSAAEYGDVFSHNTAAAQMYWRTMRTSAEYRAENHCKQLLTTARRRVLFRSFRCKADGMHLMVMRQTHLIRRRQNVFRLLKLGGFAVVPCCVLVMFSRTLMKFA
jgi:hypothetical protein